MDFFFGLLLLKTTGLNYIIGFLLLQEEEGGSNLNFLNRLYFINDHMTQNIVMYS